MHVILLQLRHYAIGGWRHRWKALMLAWVICLGGWFYAYSLPNQYRSSARIYADADIILSQLLSGLAVDSRPGSQVELLQRTLLSRPNMERVAARTGLDLRATTVAGRDALLTNLAANIRIAAQTRNLFTITYTDTDPRMAQDVVQTVLTMFMEQATANDRVQMENARNFINQQIASYEAQLREAEQRRAEFRARYAELLPGDAGVSGLESARGRLLNTRDNLEDAIQRREMLRQQLEVTPQTLRLPDGSSADPRVIAAEQQLRELRLRFTDSHPAVVAARNELNELRANPGPRPGAANIPRAQGGTGIPNPLYEQLRVRLLDTETQIASFQRTIRQEEMQIGRMEALARTAPQLQAQFMALDRDYNVLRRQHEELLGRRESVLLAGAARVGADRVRLEIVDPPVLPTDPIGPNRVIIASGALAAGIGAGVVLAFLFVQLDRSFYTVHDLRKLGLPVIGSISSTLPVRSEVLAVIVFAFGVAGLLAAYGIVTAGGPALIARLPELVARFT
ncbi:XrtA system polysaccharide chain length determinant [Falsiroseomonas oryzae]|uniref:XrtA system polysaccharide chain length determinant n=1 Tax=Falsiroseomonas oryzae TaxID=2766473 RepID=UPI0022EB276A|nr:XrtA system polysaccharide chain length determinant [Roseomonas sp. MO-31]